MNTRIITYYVILLSLSICNAQTRLSEKEYDFFKKIPQEKIHLNSSNNLLLTGETLYYKVYSLMDSTNTYSKLSKIAYVEILNQEKEIVFNQKIRLQNGLGQGDFFVPNTLSTGSYKLIAYTQWMKNKNVFYQDDLFIVNPFIENILIKSLKAPPSIFPKTTSHKNQIIQLQKKVFSSRELVSLIINLKNDELLDDSSYSLSVRLKNPVFYSQIDSLSSKATKKPQSRLVFLPELRGELIHGRVTSKDLEKRLPTGDIAIALSIPQKGGISKITSTNAIGQFYFNLSENYTNEVAYIEVIDKGNYKIELVSNTPMSFNNLSFPKFSLDSAGIQTISKRAVYMQIENAYVSKKTDSIQKVTPYIPTLLKSMEFKYNLDDYTRFNTLKETFVEIISSAWITEKDGNTIFMAKLPENEYIDPKALVIIDGYIVKDHNSIIDFNPRKIHRISVSKKTYKFNSEFFEGVIYIETKDGEYTPDNDTGIFSFKLSKPAKNKIYFSPNYKKNDLERIPDYRTQLLWEPNLNLRKKTISFYTSDVKGDFEIVLEGYAKTGEYIHVKQEITVK